MRPLLVLLLLCAALTPPARAQALNPFESTFEQQVQRLQDRVSFYRNNYPDVKIPGELAGGGLAALASSGPAALAGARKLQALANQLDRVVLGLLKNEIYQIGAHISGEPTTRANFDRRKFLILDFHDTLKRQGIPAMVYFPKGEKDLVALQLGNEDAYRVADMLLTSLALKLKEDVKKRPPPGQAGATDSGGDGGGGGGGGGADSMPVGGGGLSGFEESAAPPPPAPTHRPAPPAEHEVSWIERFKLIVSVGVVAVILGSLLALLLPRVRAGMLGMMRRVGAKNDGAMLAPAEDDIWKKGLLAVNRGDYKRALTLFEKVKNPMKAPDVAYQRAICHIRLLEPEQAGHQLAQIEMERTGLDELFRLGQACEESRMLDWAIRLYEHVERVDPSFRGVAPKVAKLKKELSDETHH